MSAPAQAQAVPARDALVTRVERVVRAAMRMALQRPLKVDTPAISTSKAPSRADVTTLGSSPSRSLSKDNFTKRAARTGRGKEIGV